MTHHPHVHMIVPGGVISLDSSLRWSSPAPLLPAGTGILQAVPWADACERSSPRTRPASSNSSASMPISPGETSPPTWRCLRDEDVAPSPFGGPEAVPHLALYPPRRHLQPPADSFDHNGVTFKYKDYRADGRATSS